MQSDYEGFWYPIVDMGKCIDCGLCEKTCPILKKHVVEKYPGQAYGCINKDEQIRQQSSSGGVFSAIGERVISNNGVVFGAGFDEDFNVLHSWADDLTGLANFRGSKYVQSYIGDAYKQAEDFLKQGRQVLFSGTPCQIAGLRSYLDKDYQDLVCLDIICYGVPSPLVWKKYRSKVAENKKLQGISFRDKTLGWKRCSVRFTYSNGDKHLKDFSTDKFMQGFLGNIYLRPACYNCNFKTLNRQSDLTLADFWGVENVLPSFDDEGGTSLVLVNSQKGNKMFLSIIDKINYEKVNINQAILYNQSAVKSVTYNPKRDKFFQELSGGVDINKLINNYTNISFSRKVYLKLRIILSPIKRMIHTYYTTLFIG